MGVSYQNVGPLIEEIEVMIHVHLIWKIAESCATLSEVGGFELFQLCVTTFSLPRKDNTAPSSDAAPNIAR